MGFFSKKKNNKAAVQTDDISGENFSALQEAGGFDPQLVSVIMAAISAYEGSSTYNSSLVIRKINRVSGNLPAWGTQGNRDAIAARIN